MPPGGGDAQGDGRAEGRLAPATGEAAEGEAVSPLRASSCGTRSQAKNGVSSGATNVGRAKGGGPVENCKRAPQAGPAVIGECCVLAGIGKIEVVLAVRAGSPLAFSAVRSLAG